MSEETFCGIKVSGERETPCGLAFLSDDVETFSETDDEQILKLIEERQPKIIAFSTSMQRSRPGEGFSEDEDELVDEGHSFLPRGMVDKDEIERAIFLRDSIKRLSFIPEMIECRPAVTMEALDIEGDADLEDFGIETSSIHNTQEFDAVLAAVTAKFYANDRFKEKGFVVPEQLE